VKVWLVIVLAAMGMLNVTWTVALVLIPVAPPVGLVVVTSGVSANVIFTVVGVSTWRFTPV
jgi:hypothetical protein